jgi:hypothetical protein
VVAAIGSHRLGEGVACEPPPKVAGGGLPPSPATSGVACGPPQGWGWRSSHPQWWPRKTQPPLWQPGWPPTPSPDLGWRAATPANPRGGRVLRGHHWGWLERHPQLWGGPQATPEVAGGGARPPPWARGGGEPPPAASGGGSQATPYSTQGWLPVGSHPCFFFGLKKKKIFFSLQRAFSNI